MKLISAVLCIAALPAQIPDAPNDKVAEIRVNYTDANSGAYTLPDPLRLANGKSVKDAKTWQQKRRPEIVKLFEELQFGRTPPAPSRYPYQFAENYSKYAKHPNDSPVDAHMLTAPRPLLLQTGVTDKWSDPKGEYLAALAAAPVYKRFGKSTPLNPEVPPVGQSVMTTLGYQMHQRGHGMIPADWDVFLQYMRTHFKS